MELEGAKGWKEGYIVIMGKRRGGQATKGGERGVGDGVNVYFFGVKRVLWYALHNILFKSLEHLAACER